MKQYMKSAGFCAVIATVTSVPAFAAVPINQYLSVDGYAVAAGAITDRKDAGNDYSLFDSGLGNLDSIKFGIAGKYQDFGGYISLLYVPEAADEAGILDVYVTWTKNEFTVTAGKFLSYLGYESFYPINLAQISYSLVSGIPGYHTGAKVDYAGKTFTAGAAVVDSLQAGNGFNEGDGDFSDLGFEAYVSFTGIEKLTVFFGAGYDMGNNDTDASSQWVFDLWGSYAVNEKLTLAAEIAYAEDVADFSWLVLGQYTFTDPISAAARISGVKADGSDSDGYKYTLSPTYRVNEYLSLRGEISYTDWTGGGSDEYFYALQALFQF